MKAAAFVKTQLPFAKSIQKPLVEKGPVHVIQCHPESF